ncbi:ribosomal L1 domain-containing protein 1 [Leptodactylus fuscus]|uniref:ribosomal L1 domain-containing protein 1 n=1 Tax=Leptodactylus fuscus TaxID=238119 RepID=UPI003F4F230E
MAETVQHGVDSDQVKKAIKALLAYQKTRKNANSLLLNEHDRISLMVTVWRIPSKSQVIRIPLPHGIRPDTCDVCLFTKDEPNMSTEQTEKFYRKLLNQNGVTQITEIIPLKKMKKEYKPYEAKLRLLGSFDLFLADARIRRLLPSHIGKHFYKEKKEPLSVDLKNKKLAAELNRYIQGTQLHITNKGCCYTVRVGHTAMKVEEIVENILKVSQVLAEKLPMKWTNVKVLHLKTQSSVALPIYNSSFDSLKELRMKVEKKKKKSPVKKSKPETADSEKDEDQLIEEKDPATEQNEPEDAEEEIPQLVPIQGTSSSKKKKKTSFKEESKLDEKGSETEEKVHLSSTKKTKPKKRKMDESEETPSKPKKELPLKENSKESEEQETPPKRSVLKKTPSKHKKELPSGEESKEPEEQETPPKRSILKKTPSKHKKELPSEESQEPEEQETPPKRSILKKTPKKTPSKSAAKLTKSARKAPQTPKQKQTKKMKTPQSV